MRAQKLAEAVGILLVLAVLLIPITLVVIDSFDTVQFR
jgi:hypothetical protein